MISLFSSLLFAATTKMDVIPKMAYHTSQQHFTTIASHVMATLSRITVDPDNPRTFETGDKPIWLVAIDYTTLGSLILVMAVSAILLASSAFKAWRGGAIKLEETTKDDVMTRKEALAETLLQNMDHTLHEDGEAVDSAKFWRQVSYITIYQS
jgi:hypothetical protein